MKCRKDLTFQYSGKHFCVILIEYCNLSECEVLDRSVRICIHVLTKNVRICSFIHVMIGVVMTIVVVFRFMLSSRIKVLLTL